MWYFAWILGVALACCLGVINGIWFELNQSQQGHEDAEQ